MKKENEEFLYDISKGRAYYGNAIGRGDSDNIWTDSPYQSGYDLSNTGASKLLKLGIGIGAAQLIKKYPDAAIGITRAFEDHALPFKWGRTFGISGFMSNQESVVRQAMEQGHFVSGKQVDSQLATYLQALTKGKGSDADFRAQGYTLLNDKLYLGNALADPDAAKEVLGHAEVVRVAEGSSNAPGTAWTKSNLSPRLNAKFNFVQQEIGDGVTITRPTIGEMPYQIKGAETKEAARRANLKAIGSEFLVYRFNRLLSEEFQSNPITAGLAKNLKAAAPNLFAHGLGVAVDTPWKTYKSLAGKLSLLTVGLPMAYQQADWAVEQILGFGPTKIAATAYVGARLAYAHLVDFVGIPGIGDLYDLQDSLENLAPGMTSPWNIAGIGISGFAMAGTAIGLLETAETARYASKYGDTSLGFWERFRKAGEVIHPQFLNFGINERGAHQPDMSDWTKSALNIGRKLGTASPGSLYDSPHTRTGKLWKKFISMGVADTRAPTPQDVKPLNLRFPVIPTFSMGRATMVKAGGALGAITALAVALPVTAASVLGLFVPDERPEELEAIYSGRKEVAVKKGRFWEFGRNSFEGEEIEYYRPHWYARMMDNAKEEAIWGDEVDRSPISKFILSEFTDHLERKHYYDRPYPITALPFSDVPVIGPILSNTIGRIIKPPQLMHQEEWEDDGWFKVAAPGRGESYATELGEMPGGVPESPYSLKRTFGRQANLISQQAGLVGYAQRSMVEGFSGTPGIADQGLVLESFNKVTSTARGFYDSSLGSMVGTNEAYRRLYPSEEKALQHYNPIRNTMPEWIPGAGSGSIDFQHGDPYTKIAEGEYRLPGRGYAARFEELRGVDPNDYPLIHKFKILADIAPHSREFRNMAEQAKSAFKSGSMDEHEESIYLSTLEQQKAKRTRKKFVEYQNEFGDQNKYGSNNSKGLLAALNENTASGNDRNIIVKGLGAWAEAAMHFQSPIEYIFPLSPESKFNPTRTSVESYEREILYGTTNAFWNRPIKDFMSPTAKTVINKLGYDGVFPGTQNVRRLEEYFDVLKYIKNTRLANIAQLNGDEEARVIFNRRKKQTLFGVNPYTANETSIMKALPRRDRDYFEAFSNASSAEERERILEMVPSNQRNLYLARWKLKYVEDIEAARDQDMVMGNALDKASDEINAVYAEAKAEGFPSSPELYKAFMDSKYPKESYGDWYRRTQVLNDLPLPGPDWVGWHPSVDLEDIKLKTVLELGEDMHDYNLWPSRLNSLAGKPFINSEAIRPILNPGQGNTAQRLNELFAGNQMHSQIEMKKNWGYEDRQSITVELEQ